MAAGRAGSAGWKELSLLLSFLWLGFVLRQILPRTMLQQVQDHSLGYTQANQLIKLLRLYWPELDHMFAPKLIPLSGHELC